MSGLARADTQGRDLGAGGGFGLKNCFWSQRGLLEPRGSPSPILIPCNDMTCHIIIFRKNATKHQSLILSSPKCNISVDKSVGFGPPYRLGQSGSEMIPLHLL